MKSFVVVLMVAFMTSSAFAAGFDCMWKTMDKSKYGDFKIQSAALESIVPHVPVGKTEILCSGANEQRIINLSKHDDKHYLANIRVKAGNDGSPTTRAAYAR